MMVASEYLVQWDREAFDPFLMMIPELGPGWPPLFGILPQAPPQHRLQRALRGPPATPQQQPPPASSTPPPLASQFEVLTAEEAEWVAVPESDDEMAQQDQEVAQPVAVAMHGVTYTDDFPDSVFDC